MSLCVVVVDADVIYLVTVVVDVCVVGTCCVVGGFMCYVVDVVYVYVVRDYEVACYIIIQYGDTVDLNVVVVSIGINIVVAVVAVVVVCVQFTNVVLSILSLVSFHMLLLSATIMIVVFASP